MKRIRIERFDLMKLSLCIIVKNEEKVLERCLKSVKNIVDEIIIVDTGSSDQSKKIANLFTNKVYDFEWCNDFSKARNFAASKASNEWVLVLDADEFLDHNEFMEELEKYSEESLKNIDGLVVNIINFLGEKGERTAQHKYVRIYNKKNMTFVRSIHEQLVRVDNEEPVLIPSSFNVYHSGYLQKTKEEKKKSERNTPLVLNEIKNNKNSGFDYFNIANEYKQLNKLDEALANYVRSYELVKNSNVEWKQYSLIYMIEVLLRLERYEDSLAVSADLEKLHPTAVDFIFLSAEALIKLGRYEDAIVKLNYIIEKNTNKELLAITTIDYLYYFPYLRLAQLHQRKNNIEDSINWYLKAFKSNKLCKVSVESILRLLFLHYKKEEYLSVIPEIISNIDKKDLKVLFSRLINLGFTQNVNEILNLNDFNSFLNSMSIKLLASTDNDESLSFNHSLEDIYKSIADQIIDLYDLIILAHRYDNINPIYKTIAIQSEFELEAIQLFEIVNNNPENINSIERNVLKGFVERMLAYNSNLSKDLIHYLEKDELLELYFKLDKNKEFFNIYKNHNTLHGLYKIEEDYIRKCIYLNEFDFAEKNAKNRFDGNPLIYANQILYIETLILNNKYTLAHEQVQFALSFFKESDYLWELNYNLVSIKNNNIQFSKNLMHVCYVLNNTRVCGGVKVVITHINSLVEKGIKVSLVTYDDEPSWIDFKGILIRVETSDYLHNYIPDCDVIIATYYDHLELISKNVFDIPIVYFEQGDIYLFKDSIENYSIMEKIKNNANYIITVSKGMQNFLYEKFKISSMAIPNASDMKVRKNNSFENDNYLLVVGDYRVAFKQIKELGENLSAFKELFGLKTVLISPVNVEKSMYNHFDEVLINPKQDIIAKYFERAFAYVSSSLHESFSLPIIEAMSVGCPVIAIENIGNKDYVINNYNYIEIKDCSILSLDEAIKKLLNPEVRNRLISNGQLTSKQYSWDLSINKLIRFIEGLAWDNKKNNFYNKQKNAGVNMHGTYVGNDKVLTNLAFGGKAFVSSNDMSLMPELVSQGFIEPGLTNFLLENVKDHTIFVDIGANIGYYTILIASRIKNGKVYAIEANPSTYNLLKDNLNINYINNKVVAINNAIYSRNEIIEFYVTSRFSGNASVKKHNDNYYDLFDVDGEVQTIQIEAMKLDDLINEEVIDFVKIDIEGGEYQAFLGMEKLIKDGNIKNIIFELNQLRLSEEFLEFKEFLKGYEKSGFTFSVLDQTGQQLKMTVDSIFEYDFLSAVVMQSQ